MASKNKNIVIFGANGLLGTELKQMFADLHPIALERKHCDIGKKSEVDAVLEKAKPALVINAAAFSNVEEAEDKKTEAMRINGKAVGHIAKACAKHEALLIHYSTDYVFGGRKKEGYNENDRTASSPLNVYGESKLLGEKELKNNTKNYYLMRTSWLFGGHGRDFTDAILGSVAKGKKELNVVNDQYGKPTYAKDLAQATRVFVQQRMPAGTYHVVNEGATTWFDYAKYLIDLENKENSEEIAINPVSSKEFKTKAKRPKYSILNNNKFMLMRPWQEALEEHLDNRSALFNRA